MVARDMKPRAVQRALATRCGALPNFASDFAHHATGVARLNHGSFGSPPTPVLEAASAWRDDWLAQPDRLYFSGELESSLRSSVLAAARAMGVVNVDALSIVENSTVAAAIVANRWRECEGRVLILSVAYGGVWRALETIIGRDRMAIVDVPFPGTSHRAVIDGVHAAAVEHRPRFAMIDHISSQPAIELPVADVVDTLRAAGVTEIAIDGAHALGQLDHFDVPSLGVDWYFTNVHKWAFGAPTACVLYGEHPANHVVPSWAGPCAPLSEASLWTGTRDYSSFVAVREACRYLDEWRSESGDTAPAYNRRGLKLAATDLRRAWGVSEAYDEDDCFCAMGMIRLPAGIDVSKDIPGQPTTPDSLRSQLRDRYAIEAAVGGFHVEGRLEGFVRLSHAVYNTDCDFARLRDAVLDLAANRPVYSIQA